MSDSEPDSKQLSIKNWSSPWITVVSPTATAGDKDYDDDDDDEQKDGASKDGASCPKQEDKVVEIPENGWYALFFGSDEALFFPRTPSKNSRKRLKKKQRLDANTNNAPKESPPQKATTLNQPFALAIQQNQMELNATRDSATAEDPTTSTSTAELPLPIYDRGWALSSSRIGHLIFLTKRSQLHVVSRHQHQDKPENPTTDPIDHTKNDLPIRWRVSFHCYEAKDSSNQQPQPSMGTLAVSPQKRFRCSMCRQTFPVANGLKQHQDIRHNNSASGEIQAEKAYQTNNLWTQPLTVLYQDDAMLVIDKPQGMPVMGSNMTLQKCPLLMPLKGTKIPDWPKDSTISDDSKDSILGKPRPVHRLDSATGGVLVVAKTKRTESRLRITFQERDCHKTYRAVVYGKIEAPGICSEPLSGKASTTKYFPLRHSRSLKSKDQWLTVVELLPVTGRKHQLRKHMQFLQHPIVGDRRYGGGNKIFCPQSTTDQEPHMERLCLWALQIEFPHPVTKENTIVSMAEPQWLGHVLSQEQSLWEPSASES